VVGAKLGIPVDHVEAGLRSYGRSMPEEINRVLTDHVADFLFTPSRDADANLLREGIAAEQIHFVGDVMIDTLVRLLPQIRQQRPLEQHGLRAKDFALVTLHRPSNVDDPAVLRELLLALQQIAQTMPVVFSAHLGKNCEAWVRSRSVAKAPHPAAARISRLHGTDGRGGDRPHRLRRRAGRDYFSRSFVSDHATEHRAAHYHFARHQPARFERRSGHLPLREALAEPRRQQLLPELWDGRAAERIVDVRLSAHPAPRGRTATQALDG
jgi:hypothetical protein